LIARTLAAAAALAGLLAAAAGPSALSELVVGKPATALTFAPIGGAPRPMVEPGKPTVVIAFASWCAGCLDEMPRNLQDYARYKDRVNFLGVDYYDSTAGGNGVIAKFAIPFPVERLDLDEGAPTPGPSLGPGGDTIALHGVTPKTLPLILPSIKSQLGDVYPVLADVAQHCAALSESECIAYAHTKGVGLDTTGHVVTQPSPAPAGASSGAAVNLPATFVIDANGVVVRHIEGYAPADDPIPAELAKLGIR
jgi:thiol-disulfide isomerase/thioredoxin